MQPPEKRSRTSGRTFSDVIKAYLASPKFAKLADGTRENYRHLLELAAVVLGGHPIEVIRPALVQAFLDELHDFPGKQQNAKVALKAVERWAIVRDLLPSPITLGTEVPGSEGGHKPWTDRQVETAINHAKPELSRVVLLASSTGQRGSDLIKMAWSDLEEIDGRLGIHVKQKKTGLELWIPFTLALAEVVATWERRPTPLLLRDTGKPWKDRNTLSKAWELERKANPQLLECRDLSLHGLRATACVRLSRLGCTTREISNMVGLGEPMVARYCRFSIQKEDAMAAVYRLDGTRVERDVKMVNKTQKNSS